MQFSAENSPEEFNVLNNCRICMSNESQCGLFPMNEKLIHLISQMSNILVDTENVWKICVSCLNTTEKAARFRELARESDSKIRVLLEKPVQEVVECAVKEEPIDNLESDQPYPPLLIELPEFTYPFEYQTPTQEPPPQPSVSEPYEMIKMKNFVTPFNPEQAEERVWHCCGKQYEDKRFYNIHRSKSHPVQKKMKFCSYCNRRFLNMSELRTHQSRMHRGEKPSNVCNICGRTYAGRQGVDYHKRVEHPELFQ